MSTTDRTSRARHAHKPWIFAITSLAPVVGAIILGLAGHDGVALAMTTTGAVPAAVSARRR